MAGSCSGVAEEIAVIAVIAVNAVIGSGCCQLNDQKSKPQRTLRFHEGHEGKLAISQSYGGIGDYGW